MFIWPRVWIYILFDVRQVPFRKVLIAYELALGNPFKINFEETKTVQSYFSYSLSSLLGFWVVLEPFRFFPPDLLVRRMPFRQSTYS